MPQVPVPPERAAALFLCFPFRFAVGVFLRRKLLRPGGLALQLTLAQGRGRGHCDFSHFSPAERFLHSR